MLTTHTLTALEELGLHGMAAALREQTESSQYLDLPFDDRLAFLVDRETSERGLPYARVAPPRGKAPPRRLHRGSRLPRQP